MFRVKVAASLFIVFAVSGGVVYLNVADAVTTEARQRLEQRLKIAQKNLEQVRHLKDFAIIAKAQKVADFPGAGQPSRMAEILAKTPEAFADAEGNAPADNDYRYKIHQLMNDELKVWRAAFAKPKNTGALADVRREKPDLFLIIGADGIGVANQDDPAWFGQKDESDNWVPADTEFDAHHPQITATLKDGKTIRDVWVYKGSPMTVAAAPIRMGRKVMGAVIVGYRLTGAAAKADKALVDAEVAYFINDRLSQTSSLDTQSERAVKEELSKQKLWQRDRKERAPVEFDLRGERAVAFIGWLDGYATKVTTKGKEPVRVGFMTIGYLDRESSGSKGSLYMIPLFAFLGFFLSLGLLTAFFQRFMAPYDELDKGILEIINGDLDYWFDVPGKEQAGTMSQNLNIMVCHLSGRPLPDEDDFAGGEDWAEDRMFIDELDAGEFHAEAVDAAAVASGETGGLSAEVIALVMEDEESYTRRSFREYTQGLQKTGEPVQGITYEKFVETLSSNAGALQAKYGCNRVRFIVVVDERVRLKPVPIN